MRAPQGDACPHPLASFHLRRRPAGGYARGHGASPAFINVTKRGLSTNELVATWTDLLVAAVMVAFVASSLVGGTAI